MPALQFMANPGGAVCVVRWLELLESESSWERCLEQFDARPVNPVTYLILGPAPDQPEPHQLFHPSLEQVMELVSRWQLPFPRLVIALRPTPWCRELLLFATRQSNAPLPIVMLERSDGSAASNHSLLHSALLPLTNSPAAWPNRLEPTLHEQPAPLLPAASFSELLAQLSSPTCTLSLEQQELVLATALGECQPADCLRSVRPSASSSPTADRKVSQSVPPSRLGESSRSPQWRSPADARERSGTSEG
eukprot:TRINITY_DN9550_c0_g2_i1.p1 TRINITY_DN9550_c0_g2~~TRINITY_DN9550_c0_g2_i1.p1  ORF type:complete len:249 (-),score=30.06 TRINITY_DN9550_c0_g2_i1:84-830(-)